jgi:peptidoglycan/LPS O-acetylase OafA/YrhL
MHDALGQPPSGRAGFRADIEGLRGVAILLVVAYHAGVPGAAGGYVGVDVFFVLSGYLITGLLVREAESAGRVDLVRFYARRARRLLPAAALVTLATVAAGWFVYAPMEQRDLTTTALATAGYVSNLWFAHRATDYLGAAGHTDPLLHTWSLAVEEQFYLVWPVLVVLCLRRRPADAGRARLVGMTALGTVASLALALWLATVARPWAFFASPARAWEFGLGALAVLLAPRWRRVPARVWTALAWGGLAAVAAAAVAFGRGTRHPGIPTLLPVAGTALLLAAGAAAPQGGAGRLLGTKPLQWLGRLSYAWYLWHWPVLVLARAVAGDGGLPFDLACVAVALGLAAATLALLENPVRLSPALGARPAATLAGAVALTLASAGAVAAVRQGALRMQSSPAQAPFTRARHDLPDRVLSERGCHLPYFRTESPACAFGDTASATTVVLFGDSHAAHWFPALERLAREDGVRLVSLTKSGCAAADVRPRGAARDRIVAACTEWRAATLRRIVAARPALVVMASSSRHVDRADGGTGDAGIGAEAWRAGTRRTLSALSRAGIPVRLVRDTPWAGADVPGCLARAAWTAGWRTPRPCTFPRDTPLGTRVAELEARAAAGVPGVRVLDLSDAICRASPCRPVRDGRVIFTDAHHLTGTFSASLAPVLRQRLADVLATARHPAG